MPTFTLPVQVTYTPIAETLYGPDGLKPATTDSMGVDLRACLSAEPAITIQPGARAKVGTGIAIEPMRPGIAGFVYSRSGLGAKKGLTVAQGVGLIDPDYRGEIIVYLLNTSQEPVTIVQGERIAQLVFQPFFCPDFTRVPELGHSERGAGGFGHTGKK